MDVNCAKHLLQVIDRTQKVKFDVLNPEVAPGLRSCQGGGRTRLLSPHLASGGGFTAGRLGHQSLALAKEESPTPPRWPLATTGLRQTHCHRGLVLEEQLQGRCHFSLQGWGSGRRNSPKQNRERKKNL